MDDVVGRAFYELATHDDKLDVGLRDAEGKIKASGTAGAQHFEKSYAEGSTKVVGHLKKVSTAMAAIGVGIGLTAILGFFGGAVGAASDLNEEVSKSQVVFGDSADTVEAFADRADRALGQSKAQAMGAAGGFGNMFRTIGLAEDAAAGMSIQMVQLASDMASFNNEDPSDMLDRLRAGLSGEAEPLRRFGVLLSEAAVKEKAYADGIAEVGAELTEQQKVQARYNLILAQTTLQQGDFARTSTGLANSQRIQAAVWENSLARIGQALLPLAKALTQFATDALPGVADAIQMVLGIAEPMLSLMLELAKLWIEHANVIIPALAIAIGVHLVRALLAAETRAKATALAMKTLRAAALFGLPLLFELGDQVARSMEDMALSMTHSAEEAQRLRLIANAVGNVKLAQELDKWGVSLEDFNRVLEATGGDAELAFNAIANAQGNVDRAIASFRDTSAEGVAAAERYVASIIAMGESTETEAGRIEDALEGLDPAMREAVDKLMATAREVPGGLAVTLDNGTTVFAGSALALAAALPDAIQRAQDDAVEIVRLTPQALADALLEGQQAWQDSIDSYNTAVKENLLPPAERAALRNELSAAGLDLAEAFKSGDQELIAAAQAKVAAIKDRLFALQNDVPEIARKSGVDYADALAATKSLVKDSGIKLTDELKRQLIVNLKQGGIDTIASWIAGLEAQELHALQTAARIAAGVSGFLAGNSPPPRGPLHTIDRGGFNVGRAWVDALARGADPSRVLAALGGPQLALARGESPTGGFAFAPSPSQTNTETHYHLHVDGDPESVRSGREAVDLMQRIRVLEA
jgi:hypothetical protein